MGAIITIFKNELKAHTDLLENLRALAAESKEFHQAYAFSVNAQSIMAFLNLLDHTDVQYGTHFSREQIMSEGSLDERVA